MRFTAGKDETDIRQMLNVGSEQCFNVLFRIFTHLLELVKRDNTRSVGIFQTCKNFRKSVFRLVYFA